MNRFHKDMAGRQAQVGSQEGLDLILREVGPTLHPLCTERIDFFDLPLDELWNVVRGRWLIRGVG